MSRPYSDSNWRARLTERLEPLLKSPKLAAEISMHKGVPFALFAYPPTAERDVRREVQMLARRIENQTARKVHTISMADLVWEAIRTAYPPDGQDLFEAERSYSSEDTERRLEMLEEQMRSLLSDVCPLDELLRKRVDGLDPERDLVFLTRVGALFPSYRAHALLENLMGVVRIPSILFYPGTRTGRNQLRFMDSLEALHSYRHKIF